MTTTLPAADDRVGALAAVSDVAFARLYERSRRSALVARLRQRRRELGLSQDALADRAGLTRRTVNRFESGRYSMAIETLWRYADALGVTASYLLDDSEFDHADMVFGTRDD